MPRHGEKSLADASDVIPAALRWEAVQEALDGRTIGRRIVYFASTGSTNDVARRLAAAGEPEGTVVLADEQTAGRGRAGKSRWLTPAGTSIAVSVVLRPHLTPQRLPLLSLMSGVAACEAIQSVARVNCSLKWPNDVMVKDRKLGGILVESALVGSNVAFAVLGIGLNGNLLVNQLGRLPDAASVPTTLLAEAGIAVSREDVLIALLTALDRLYTTLPAGASSLLARYRLRLQTLKQSVCIMERTDATPIEGIAEDITQEGALIVRLPSGERCAFAHGAVSVRTASPAEVA